MDRRSFLKNAGIAGTGAMLSGRSDSGTEARPNILLIMSDQHSARVLGCNGNPDVQTPNLDGLARDGVNFTRCYCQQGICVPSRVSTLTSRYVRTHGIFTNDCRAKGWGTPFPAILRDSGYQTAAIGKRHLQFDWDQGFQFTRSAIKMECRPDQKTGVPNYLDWIAERGQLEEYEADFRTERDHKNSPTKGVAAHESNLAPENTVEGYIGQQSIEYLRKHRDPNRPFFLWTSFVRPHQPFTLPPPYSRMYEPGKIEMPVNWREPPENLPVRLRTIRERTSGVWNFGAIDPMYLRQVVAWYYGLVTEIDDWVGRILATLDDIGLSENTIVIYTADHGDFAGEFGLMEKHASVQNLYEAILRIPSIWCWKGRIDGGRTSPAQTESIDVMPTLFDLIGMAAPSGMEGRSVVPLLNGSDQSLRSEAFSESAFAQTVITDRFKFSQNTDTGESHLFDLEEDPWETTNLIEREGAREAADDLQARLAAWMENHPVHPTPILGRQRNRRRPG